MTDPVNPDPNTPPAPPSYQAPSAPNYQAPGAPAYAPAGAGVKQTLSLVSFIVGIVAFVFGWSPFFGLIAGVVALILGLMARTREPAAPKWMWILGIVLGAIAILSSLIWTIVDVIAWVTVASIPNSY